MPTTWRQYGASASASRPLPVPTSRTTRSFSGSAHRSAQKRGLTPAGGAAGDGSIGGAGHEPRVLCQHSARVAWLGTLDGLEAALELGRRHLDVEPALLDVDDDDVAGLEGSDGTTIRRLGSDVADHEAVGGAREPTVGHQRHRLAQPGAL